MKQESGKVIINYRDGSGRVFDECCNVSISSGWAFFKFTDGRRAQIPSEIIKELFEEGNVYIKGRTEGKTNV